MTWVILISPLVSVNRVIDGQNDGNGKVRFAFGSSSLAACPLGPRSVMPKNSLGPATARPEPMDGRSVKFRPLAFALAKTVSVMAGLPNCARVMRGNV